MVASSPMRPANGAVAAASSIARPEPDSAKTKTSANRRPAGASGSVIARVALLTKLGVSAPASRARDVCAINVNAAAKVK